MGGADEYRNQAKNCLRLANAQEDGDRPLWVTLAQSWLRLAEHADQLSKKIRSTAPRADESRAHALESSDR